MLLFFPTNDKLFLICFSFSEVSVLSIADIYPLLVSSFSKSFDDTIEDIATSFSYGKNWCVFQGPLAWALIVWRCSLVFSSVDKIVSVLIHLLPGA